jgi:excisionase family DNA binding protein
VIYCYPIALQQCFFYIIMELYDRLLTVKETADVLKLNVLTVYDYIRSGRLNAVKLGRYYRIEQKDLMAFIESHKTQ